MKKPNPHRVNTIVLIVSLPMLLLLSACTGFQLLASQEPGLIDHAVSIEQRIRAGFDETLLGPPFRAKIDSTEPVSFAVEEVLPTMPLTLEVAEMNLETFVITARISAANWESIHVDSNVAGEPRTWLKSDSGWQPISDQENIAFQLFILAGLGNPYASFWPPSPDQVFRSRAVGIQSTPNGLAEVYEVYREYPNSDGTSETSNFTEVWIDAESGTPILSISENFTITYEVDDSIEIELP